MPHHVEDGAYLASMPDLHQLIDTAMGNNNHYDKVRAEPVKATIILMI